MTLRNIGTGTLRLMSMQAQMGSGLGAFNASAAAADMSFQQASLPLAQLIATSPPRTTPALWSGNDPSSALRQAPSGLFKSPRQGSDLVDFARGIIAHAKHIPNNRVVIDTLAWQSPPALTTALQQDLQRLADDSGISICIKTSAPPHAVEIDPELTRMRDQAKGPLMAMPGMSMSFRPMLTMRQELRLELRLLLKLELRQLPDQELEEFYDDVWGPDRVPPEIFEIQKLLASMAQTSDKADYLWYADTVLDLIQKIRLPYFRLMAVCNLAEELSNQPSLKGFVDTLYKQHFNKNFNASSEYDQPSLALMVAASQLRAGANPKHVERFVTMAMNLAKKAKVDFRGSDARNLQYILSHWPRSKEDLEKARTWVDDFVKQEYWVPTASEPLSITRETEADEIIDETQDEAMENEVPADEAHVAAEEVAPPQPPPLSASEKSYARSRLIHQAMHRIIEEHGLTEEVFRTLIHLASHDTWEETAAIAYKLLSAHEPFQQQLRDVLGHFNSDYYRAKAEWYLVEGEGGDADAARENVLQLLEQYGDSPDVTWGHERASLGQAEDPLPDIAPEAEGITIPSDLSHSTIERWASQQVEAWQTARQPAPTVESTAPVTEETWDESDELDDDEHREKRREDEARQGREDIRRGELYSMIGRSLMEHHPDDPSVHIAALEFVATAPSPRTIAEFMNELPVAIRPEVARAAANIATDIEEPYYQALAKILMLRVTDVNRSTANMVGSLINAFIDIATEDDETVSNLEAIADLALLARNLIHFKSAYTKLLTLARKRVKLYQEEIEEIVEEIDNRTEVEDREEVDYDLEDFDEDVDADEQSLHQLQKGENAWRDLHEIAQSHILASTAFFDGSEENVEKRIKKLESPFNRAMAYRMRAHLLSNAPGRMGISRDYMARAVKTAATIQRTSLRVGLGMKIYDDTAENPLFDHLRKIAVKSLGNPYAESEASRLLALTQHARQGDWYPMGELPQLINDGDVPATALGRVLSPKQMKKMLKKDGLSPTHTALIIRGHIKNGPYQRAFDVIRKYIEQDETQESSKHTATLHDVFMALLMMKDQKALEYMIERKYQLIDEVARRQDPLSLTDHDWRWLNLSFRVGLAKEFVPLLSSRGLDLPDRLTLLKKLSREGLLEENIKEAYDHLDRQGKGHLFFDIIQGIQEAMPGIAIRRDLVIDLLNDPRVREDENNVELVLSEWAEMWHSIEQHRTPDERLHALTSNPLMAERYYRERIPEYDFGSHKLTFEQFNKILRQMRDYRHSYHHAAMQRWEEALERAQTTTPEEREASIARIDAAFYLEGADKEFLKGIAQSDEPMSEEDIKRIDAIGRNAEMDEPEALLPSNRQRMYRLYRGKPPIVTPRGESTPGEFVRKFTPVAGAKTMTPLHPGTQFFFTFEDVKKLAHANWAIKAIRDFIAEYPKYAEKAEGLTALLEGEHSLKDFALGVSRIHTSILVDHYDMSAGKARGAIKRARNKAFEEHLMPLLADEHSHILLSDNLVATSERIRENLALRRFDDFRPHLDHFIQRHATSTDRKMQIAERLGLATEWNQSVRDRVQVEMELLADVLQLEPRVYERFFVNLSDAMQYQAVARTDSLEELRSMAVTKSKGFYEVRFIDDLSIYTYMRIADFRPCCISTGSGYFSNVPGYHKDRMTLVFAIYDPDSRRAVGHMVGHLGLSGKKEEPTYFLNGLYLRTQHRGEEMEQASFGVLEEFAQLAGIKLIRHGINPYHDLTRTPPKRFTSAKSHTVRLQTLDDDEGNPIPLYNDLHFDRSEANQTQTTTHYQRKVKKE